MAFLNAYGYKKAPCPAKDDDAEERVNRGATFIFPAGTDLWKLNLPDNGGTGGAWHAGSWVDFASGKPCYTGPRLSANSATEATYPIRSLSTNDVAVSIALHL